MSMLSALVSDDAPSHSNEAQPSPQPQATDLEAKFDEILKNGQIESSPLGDAVNNVKVHWNQLLSYVVSDVGHVQPTHDHVKELAEYSVKQLKESCLDVTKEFHKATLEWRMLNPEEALKEDISDYKEAVDRQNGILNSMDEKFTLTMERYKNFTR